MGYKTYKAIWIFLIFVVACPAVHPLQSQPELNKTPGIGSATVIHKPVGKGIDRWEITFHDAMNKNRVLWVLVKTSHGKSFIQGNYRIRKKPFSEFGLRDMLGLVYQDRMELPVHKGKAKLAMSGQELNFHARLKTKKYGTLKYDYSGKYRIIDIK